MRTTNPLARRPELLFLAGTAILIAAASLAGAQVQQPPATPPASKPAQSSGEQLNQSKPAQSSAKQSTSAHKPAQSHKKPVAAHPIAATPQPAPTPQAAAPPEMPHWPVNDHPAQASVQWNSQGLRIEAQNSSLQQILKDVTTATGTKVEGLTADQRIFGAYGPGQARDVLAQLLDGSGYNILMIGDQGQGVPRQIVLTTRAAMPLHQAGNNQPAANDEEVEPEEPPQPPQMPPPAAVRPPGVAPGGPPRTPQEIMQEMQQRQQQILQQQQQNPPQ